MSGALLATAASPALAGPEGTWFDGSMVTYKATPQCGESVGGSFKSTFRPAGLENNNADFSWISFVYGRGGGTISLPKDGKSGSFEHGGISNRGHQWWSTDAGQKFSNRVVKPSKIKKNTKKVSVSITLNKFWVKEGCKITFKGNFTAHPNN